MVGLPHADFGEGVTAIVVAKDTTAFSEEVVRKSLVEVLAKYKVPKRVICVDSLPRNAMGKVQKKTLREAYAKTYA